MKLYIGIDYSITSPSLCTYYGNKENFSVTNCKFFYYNKNEQQKQNTFIHQTIPDEIHKSPINRFSKISNWALNNINALKKQYNNPEVIILIEDYSFGSKGKVFELAENCGILKYMLECNNYEYKKIAPTTLKKYATGSGRSNKEDMYKSFFEQTQYKLKEIFQTKRKTKIGSPTSDLVDSYFLCKYLVVG